MTEVPLRQDAWPWRRLTHERSLRMGTRLRSSLAPLALIACACAASASGIGQAPAPARQLSVTTDVVYGQNEDGLFTIAAGHC